MWAEFSALVVAIVAIAGFVEWRVKMAVKDIREIKERLDKAETLIGGLSVLAEVLRDENVRQMRRLVSRLEDERKNG